MTYLKISNSKIIEIEKFNSQKKTEIKVNNLFKVFATDQKYVLNQFKKTIKNISLLKIRDFNGQGIFYEEGKYFYNLQMTFLLKSNIFKQLYSFSFVVYKQEVENFFSDNKLLIKNSKKWFCHELKFIYLISFFQKKQIFNYNFELLLFQFFQEISLQNSCRNFNNSSSFREINKKSNKLINKVLDKRRNSKSVLIKDLLLNSQTYSDFYKLHFFYLNTNYLNFSVQNLNESLLKFSQVGQYGPRVPLRAKKLLSPNLTIKTLNSRDKIINHQINKFKLKLIKRERNYQNSVQTLINYFLFELKKKFYKLKNYSKGNKFFYQETIFFETQSLKTEICLNLFPLIMQILFTNELNLFFLLKKTEFFSIKNNILEFYFLKKIFNIFYYFCFQKISSKSNHCLSLKNFCQKIMKHNFAQPFNVLNHEFYNKLKKEKFDLLSLTIIQRNLDQLNVNTNLNHNSTVYYLRKNFVEYLNRQNLKFSLINSKRFNSSNFIKLIYFNKTLVSQNNNLLKLIDFNIANYANTNIFLCLGKINFKTYFELQIEKVFFDSFKKVNLWSSKIFFTNKIKILLENNRIKKFYEKRIFLIQKPHFVVKQRYLSQKFLQHLVFLQPTSNCFINPLQISKIIFFYKNSLLFECFISIFKGDNQLLIVINSKHFKFKTFQNFFTEFRNWYFNYSNKIIKLEDSFSKTVFSEKKIPSICKTFRFIRHKLKKDDKKIKCVDLDKKRLISITIFYENFSIFFLENGSFFISPHQIKVFLYLKMLKKIIKQSSTKTQEGLILKLSTKIYSWCYYYRYSSNKKILNYCDYRLLTFLWRWACRRHNSKSKKWIKFKYFYQFSNSNWIFGNSFSNSLQSQFFKKNNFVLIYLPSHSQIFFNLKKLVYYFKKI